ncbi:helix-turn-helix domain-containing protein [Aquimarina sp. LLG6339-5]|uniref:helix-turn-helix domain-containing protein n=1 Tax=Aquimarina sp. LLG6339-5 TaxID=3160830 RepID=UPI0038650F5E
MKYLRLLIFNLFVLIPIFSFGQSSDSLSKLPYEVLIKTYKNLIKTDLIKAKPYVQALLKKAKANQKITPITSGYREMAFYYYKTKDFEKYITYLDSAIVFGKQSNYKYYPTSFYVNKGTFYSGKGMFDLTLDNYLKGLEWAEKRNDLDYKAIIQHNIALLKRKTGNYEESITLFKEALAYEAVRISKDQNDSLSYLVTLSDLIITFRKNKEIDSALTFNKKGIKMAEGKDIQNLFLLHKGVIQYYTKDYDSSIININNALNTYEKSDKNWFFENYNLIDAYLHLGKSYEATSNKEKYIAYYKKVDSIAELDNYLIPESRNAYTSLVNHYKNTGNKKQQLHYINKLIHLDSISDKSFGDLKNKITKEYDTPLLLEEKEKIITDLEKEKKKTSFYNTIITFLFVISLIGIGYYYYRQKVFKKRFSKLLDSTKEQDDDKESNNQSVSSTINKETLADLLDKLDQFEKEKGYLKNNLNSKDLAKSFNSNSSYLSKVINTVKEKNFTNYINDLRVDFAINKLKEDSIFRKYTIKAIAKEIGFNNSEAFSKAFYKKTGIYPSYFIKELNTMQTIRKNR